VCSSDLASRSSFSARLTASRTAFGSLPNASPASVMAFSAAFSSLSAIFELLAARSASICTLALVTFGPSWSSGTAPDSSVISCCSLATAAALSAALVASRLRWPVGLAGCHIEAVGRVPLWAAGQDFNHGLGHGVGAYLSVHEGPQRLSRVSRVPLEPGMILSNEPGYYREGAFGIRLENLIVVQQAKMLEGGDSERAMLDWRTLTFVPFDRRLIVLDMLSGPEREWLNSYHIEVAEKIGPRVGKADKLWLDAATAPL